MALKEYLLSAIAITISIGVSSVFAWNPDRHRYESYDLDRGPVFYEAYYYPDSNEEASNNYDEKRFFDRAAVLEKTYQVPSRRMVFPYNSLRLDSGPQRGESILQDGGEDRPAVRDAARSLDIKEISNLARTAISRDLENWNTLESYLDRVNHQDQAYRRRLVDTGYEPGYMMEQPARGIGPSLPGAFKEPRDLSTRQLYEEVLEEPADPSRRIQSAGDQRNVVRRLNARDVVSGGSLGPFGPNRYQNQAPGEPGAAGASGLDVHFAKEARDPRSMVGPSEDIFAPRPQVINYIFSRRADAPAADQGAGAKETKDAPRNYGDNLIQEEVKEEAKDVKVTSIEISEVPKHKTRHHHGEWPKRDYSKRHQ